MRDLRISISCLLVAISACLEPVSSAASPDLRLIALVPRGAQVVSGISALPHQPQPDYFLLVTHNNIADLQDLLALYGTDGSRTIRQMVFVSIADGDGQLREHSLLVSGRFDQAHIYKSATEGGAILTTYRGIPVVEIQPFTRERNSFNDVRWLAVLDSNVLVFGTIPTLREELDRYLDRFPPDSSLLNRLARLRSKNQTWSLLSPPTRNDEIHGLLSTLDHKLAEIAESRALDLGIHYGRRIEFEYEVSEETAVENGISWQPQIQSPSPEEFRLSLLPSPDIIPNRVSARGFVTIRVNDYRAWLDRVKRYANRTLLP